MDSVSDHPNLELSWLLAFYNRHVCFVYCVSGVFVTGRKQAVSCDACECWQHRQCGTGKVAFFPFEYSDLFTRSLKSVCYPEKDTV